MLAHPIEIAFLVGILSAIATPWIVLFRYWSILPEKISIRKAKDGSPVYANKRGFLISHLIGQGVVSIFLIVVLVKVYPFHLFFMRPNWGLLLEGRGFEILILWTSLFSAVFNCAQLNRMFTGKMSRAAKVALWVLIAPIAMLLVSTLFIPSD